MKLNQKQIFFSLLWAAIGAFLAVGGALFSEAGHGSYPRESIGIALIGATIFLLSALTFVVLIIKELLGKGDSSKQSNYQKAIPDYDWRCPDCDSMVQANTTECLKCGYRDT